jgi:hypothetical protein
MISKEKTWNDVVKECEQILGCKDTADSPLQSNLPNLVRDLKSGASPQSAILTNAIHSDGEGRCSCRHPGNMRDLNCPVHHGA